MQIIYARSHTVGGWLIRAAQAFAPWSHAGIVTPDETVINARAGHGVVEEPLADFLRRYSATHRVEVACPDENEALWWARQRIGDGYDWLAVLRFIVGRTVHQDRRRWHCVELVESALIAGGRPRWRIEPARITPWQSYIARGDA